MSEGPIKQWRDAYKPPRAVSHSQAVHGLGATRGKAYCGAKTKEIVLDWKQVTCADCLAGRRADEEVAS